MKKRIIAIMLLSTMLTGLFMTACGKKEEPVNNEQPAEVVENVEQSAQSTQSETTNPEVGGWNIVNLPFEQAPEEVKTIFKNAMETEAVKATNEMFAPVTYIGSQVVSGMNYGFITKDVNGADRYVYIYQNAKNEIEKVEISKPNEKLEVLPEVSENTPAAQNESNTQEQNSQTENTQTSESSNSSNNSSNSESTTSNNNNNNSNTAENTTNNANNNVTEEKPKNIEEGIKKNTEQSFDSYVSQFNPGGAMTCELKENTLFYSYTFPEEIAEAHIPVYKEEITNTIKDNLKIYTNSAARLESDSGVEGAVVQINYFMKDGKELVSFKINKNGLVE